MITQFRAQNFKRLRDVTVELGPLNVIVGRNGVGKSSLLEALELVLLVPDAMENKDSGQARRLATSLPAFHTAGASELTLACLLNPSEELGCCSARVTAGGVSEFVSETRYAPSPTGVGLRQTLVGDTKRLEQLSRWSEFWNPLKYRAIEEFRSSFFWGDSSIRMLPEVRTLRTALHGTALAASSTAESDVPQLTNTGAGLAAVLQYLQGTRDGRLERIEQSLARIVPGVKRLRTLPVRMNQRRRVRVAVNGTESWHEEELTVTGARYELEFDGLGWIPADQLSEGTLLTLGLLTVLHNDPPDLLLLDDLDKGLHPVAQRELVKLLKELQTERPALQIVATSHSPYLVDELDAAEVFVAGACQDDPTATQIRRLDQHPDWEGNKDFLGLGEFWTSVGEDWVGADDGAR